MCLRSKLDDYVAVDPILCRNMNKTSGIILHAWERLIDGYWITSIEKGVGGLCM
jgi:hypothetical protein